MGWKAVAVVTIGWIMTAEGAMLTTVLIVSDHLVMRALEECEGEWEHPSNKPPY